MEELKNKLKNSGFKFGYTSDELFECFLKIIEELSYSQNIFENEFKDELSYIFNIKKKDDLCNLRDEYYLYMTHNYDVHSGIFVKKEDNSEYLKLDKYVYHNNEFLLNGHLTLNKGKIIPPEKNNEWFRWFRWLDKTESTNKIDLSQDVCYDECDDELFTINYDIFTTIYKDIKSSKEELILKKKEWLYKRH